MFNSPSAYVPRHAPESPTVSERIARALTSGGAALATLAGAPPLDPCANTADCNRAGQPYWQDDDRQAWEGRELSESERWHEPAGAPAELLR